MERIIQYIMLLYGLPVLVLLTMSAVQTACHHMTKYVCIVAHIIYLKATDDAREDVDKMCVQMIPIIFSFFQVYLIPLSVFVVSVYRCFIWLYSCYLYLWCWE